MATRTNHDPGIPLIVPATTATRRRKADEGGDEHGLLDPVVSLFVRRPAAAKDIEGQMIGAIERVEALVETIRASRVGDMELSGVEVGLAVSAEGTIGIATAGVETSITLSFTTKGASST